MWKKLWKILYISIALLLVKLIYIYIFIYISQQKKFNIFIYILFWESKIYIYIIYKNGSIVINSATSHYVTSLSFSFFTTFLPTNFSPYNYTFSNILLILLHFYLPTTLYFNVIIPQSFHLSFYFDSSSSHFICVGPNNLWL